MRIIAKMQIYQGFESKIKIALKMILNHFKRLYGEWGSFKSL